MYGFFRPGEPGLTTRMVERAYYNNNNVQATSEISNCSNTRAFGPNKLGIFHLNKMIEYLTALFNDSVTSCLIQEIWKPCIDIPSRNPSRTLLWTFHIGQSRFSAQQGKLWRLLCSPPSTSTCSQPLTNTDSDPDTHPLLHSIQSSLIITYCYQRWQDQRFLMQPVDCCRTTSEADNQLQADRTSQSDFLRGRHRELEHKVNTHLTEMSRPLWVNSILISAPKSSVTLFTPDPVQANTHPKIKITD